VSGNRDRTESIALGEAVPLPAGHGSRGRWDLPPGPVLGEGITSSRLSE